MKMLEPMALAPVQNPWSGSTSIHSSDGREIARVRVRNDFNDREVAERFVACVNACAGIPTDVLKGSGFVLADDETPVYELVRSEGESQ